LVSGAMNAGKTTLLRALAAEIPPSERIVTIEQALELGLDHQRDRHPDCVAMEARLPNLEGVGAISMAQLVRRSLRMNASRVIVGEVLGDEVIPMLNAMSQGRSGSMATIHADSSAGVFRRIAAYAVQAPERLPLEATNLLIAGSIHFVVHVDVGDVPVDRTTPPDIRSRRRQVASVREVVDAEGPMIVSNEVWKPDPDGRARQSAPLRDVTAAALAEQGYDHRRFARGRQW
jgi:Flp pilus assembly CpaF family ATPase